VDAGDIGGGDGGGYTRQVQEEAGLGHLPTPRRSSQLMAEALNYLPCPA
jgi:hypothetical protein